jgi:hypothetical protein
MDSCVCSSESVSSNQDLRLLLALVLI